MTKKGILIRIEIEDLQKFDQKIKPANRSQAIRNLINGVINNKIKLEW